jgi:alpha-tubulin suppressor-like RCC1 family protein
MTSSARWSFVFAMVLVGGCGRCNYDVIPGDGDAAIDPDADTTADASDAAPDAAPACRFRSLAPGRDHTCVANAVGDVYCWGRNGYGVVTPDSTNGVYPTPRKIELPAAAVEVASGNLSSCARAEDGRVWCWGAGDGGAGSPLSGVVAVDVGGPARSLAVGRYYSCAIVGPDDHVACWGTNNHGQLGDTSPDPRPAPGAVPGTTGSTAVWLGHKHACARGASGDITCWGWNVTGQLGRPGSGGDELPAVIPALAGTDQLALGGRFSCGVDDGALRCWGANDRGQLAAAGGSQSSPVR